MDPIKEAFSKIKEDIFSLKQEILSLKNQLKEAQSQQTPTHNPTNTPQQTNQQTGQQTIPTHNLPLQSLYTPNPQSSIGNRGVPTDKPTNQQTDQHTQDNLPKTAQSSHNPREQPQNPKKDPISQFKLANEILSSLDDIKKEIHLKFKSLTPQEMLVFSTLYALEDQNMPEITYKLLANNLKLSESSIRDYINKLTKKGVPIEKIRQNNKTIILKISKDLKNVATLATIQRLREL